MMKLQQHTIKIHVNEIHLNIDAYEIYVLREFILIIHF